MKTLSKITIKNKTYPLPQYLPDGTLAVVRNLDSQDIKATKTQAMVVNAYHLKDEPGIKTLQKAEGIKKFMNFPGLITTDSGGFQLFSLIQKNPKLGKIIDQGIVLYSGTKKRTKSIFTPEDSIKMQFAIGADIMMCLDDFTPPEAQYQRIESSVQRSLHWAKRCKQEFNKQIKIHKFSDDNRPLLFAPIQGHRHKKLRKLCADELLKINFDGYALGGWPFDDQGHFDYDMCEYNASLTPDNKPRFALGVGTPQNIVDLYQMGYHFFDCVLPTRDARHQRLYVFNKKPTRNNLLDSDDWYQHLYIKKSKNKNQFQPLSKYCQCQFCQNYSKAYLYHLFKINDGLAYRLATIHNLTFYQQVIQALRS